jgi:integrase
MTADGLSPRTVRYTHAVLSSAFTKAIKWQKLAVNPCKAVSLPKIEHSEMKAFTADEAKRFLEACNTDKLGLVFAFALESGMRPEEYLALKWSDLDFDKATVTVQRTLIRSKAKGGGWYFDKPKTKTSRRLIPMSENVFAKLRSHRTAQLSQMMLLGTEYERHDLVFANEFGRPLDLKNIRSRNFARILKAAGLEGFRVYDLRHSMATLMLADEVNPKVVSERPRACVYCPDIGHLFACTA